MDGRGHSAFTLTKRIFVFNIILYCFVECSVHCDGCVGPGPNNCIECAAHHQKEGDECVGTSPSSFYFLRSWGSRSFLLMSITLHTRYPRVPKDYKHPSTEDCEHLFPYSFSLEALYSFTGPYKSTATNASLWRSLQPGFLFLFPSQTRHLKGIDPDTRFFKVKNVFPDLGCH